MNHTAQSLGKYIGQKVLISDLHISTLVGVDLEKDIVWIKKCQDVFKRTYSPTEVKPILKTYDKLLEPMMFEGKEIVPIELLSSVDYSKNEERAMISKDIFNLLKLGFGAIKNDKSSTGHVDVFEGLECGVQK